MSPPGWEQFLKWLFLPFKSWKIFHYVENCPYKFWFTLILKNLSFLLSLCLHSIHFCYLHFFFLRFGLLTLLRWPLMCSSCTVNSWIALNYCRWYSNPGVCNLLLYIIESQIYESSVYLQNDFVYNLYIYGLLLLEYFHRS